jgi:hypothetical protein
MSPLAVSQADSTTSSVPLCPVKAVRKRQTWKGDEIEDAVRGDVDDVRGGKSVLEGREQPLVELRSSFIGGHQRFAVRARAKPPASARRSSLI